MKKILAIILLTFMQQLAEAQSSFLTDQKRYERVRNAISEKDIIIKDKLKESGINLNELNMLIRAFKEEDEVEVFVKKKTDEYYILLMTYSVCAKSGQLGPKRAEGDFQVPEGFYYIDRFNPASTFHLSLGINYPNLSDTRKSTADHLGGDIFIHGDCVTIGCLPMTDTKIKEIYLYALNAKNNGQSKIPVYIFPFRMTTSKFKEYTKGQKDNVELIDFWSNIKLGYDLFEKEKKELKISVNNNGEYQYGQ